MTNSNGFVVARTDHQAFGEEVGLGIGLRSVEQGYSADKATREGYGLTESDKATGQQHTWFRKLETQAGRWTRPDPYKGSMSLSDPQTFNRYSYVGNDPTNLVDPSGLDEEIIAIHTYAPRWWHFSGGIFGGGGMFLPEEILVQGGESGGGGGGGIIPVSMPVVDPKSLLCNKYIAEAADIVQKFLSEWKKYDPEQDAVGGIKTRYTTTKPFGHWEKLKNYQNGMSNLIEKYDRMCNDRNDGRGGRGGGLPHQIRSYATQKIPRKEGPRTRSLFEGPTREQVQEALRNSAAQQATAIAAAAAIAAALVVWALNE